MNIPPQYRFIFFNICTKMLYDIADIFITVKKTIRKMNNTILDKSDLIKRNSKRKYNRLTNLFLFLFISSSNAQFHHLHVYLHCKSVHHTNNYNATAYQPSPSIHAYKREYKKSSSGICFTYLLTDAIWKSTGTQRCSFAQKKTSLTID